MLPRPAAFDLFPDNPFKCSDAHSPLPMSRQSVVAGKCVTAEACVRFRASMDLGVPFQVVSSNETLFAVVASELSVTQVSLDMRLDVFFATKLLVTVLELASPLVL